MAMTKATPDVQTFTARWPDVAALPADQLALAYDGPSDTLFVDFYGQARPAASIALEIGDRDYYYLRIDVETDDVVGLQIESFLSYAVKEHPWLLGALDVARLEYVTPSQLPVTRRGAPPNRVGGDARRQLVQDLIRLAGDPPRL